MKHHPTLAVVSVLNLISGCHRPVATEQPVPDGRRLGAVFQTLDNPFFVECNAGIQEVVILEIGDGKGTAEGSRPLMQDLFRKHPTVNAVFAVNDPSALGVISALEAAGKSTGVTVVSVDGSAQGIAAVKAGPLYSPSVQFPREIGRIAAQRFYEHLDGNSVEKDIRVPIFPNRVRARGQALGSFTHWAMNAAISWTFPMIAAAAGWMAFGFYALCMVGQLAWVLTIMPETKGISLERIQEELGIE